MSTTPTEPLKLPPFYLSLKQVEDSGLLSQARLANLRGQIEGRLLMPQDPNGQPITSARLADLSPYGRWLYTSSPGHDDPWHYARQQILCAILTDAERKLLKDAAYSAAEARHEAERFAKASHVSAECWKGGVCDGDRYYGSVWEYVDELEWSKEEDGEGWWNDNGDMVSYVWAARSEPVIHSRDVADVFESQLCDNGWEDMDSGDLNGVPELQAAIEVFVEANATVTASHIDYSTAVILLIPIADASSGAANTAANPSTPSTILPS